MECANCYEIDLSQCPDTITIRAALTADTGYKVRFIDHFGNRYTFAVVSNGDGAIVLNLVDSEAVNYVAGLKELFAVPGNFLNMEISLNSGGDDLPFAPITLDFNETEYPCVRLLIVGDTEGNVIIE